MAAEVRVDLPRLLDAEGAVGLVQHRRPAAAGEDGARGAHRTRPGSERILTPRTATMRANALSACYEILRASLYF